MFLFTFLFSFLLFRPKFWVPRHLNVFSVYNPPKRYCGCLVPVLNCGQAADYSKVLAREKELEKCSGHRKTVDSYSHNKHFLIFANFISHS